MTLVRQGHPDEIAALRDWERRMREGFGFSEEEADAAGAKYMPTAPLRTYPREPWEDGQLIHEGVDSLAAALRSGGEQKPYVGPDLFDVAPPGVHALLAYRNVHRFTGVLDGTPLAVQE